MEFAIGGVDTKPLSDKGVEMVIKRVDTGAPALGPNGEPVKLVLLGPDSDVFNDLTNARFNKIRLRAAEAKAVGSDDNELEESRKAGLDLLISCTVGWANVTTPDGTEIQFSKENVRRLYLAMPAVRDQADAFIGKRANFLNAPSATL